MEGILSAITGKLGAIAFGISIPIAFMLLKRLIPNRLGKLLAGMLDKGFDNIADIDDPVERQLVYDIAIDVVKYAEYKLPDEGKGEEKYELAAAKLCKLLPFLKGREDDIEELIESAVEAMKVELKRDR